MGRRKRAPLGHRPDGRPRSGGKLLTKEEGFIAVPARFKTLTGEQFLAVTEKAHVAWRESARKAREERIRVVVHGLVFEHKLLKQIAEELHIKPGSLSAWKYTHRDRVEAAIAEAINEVNQIRAGAALSLRVGLSNETSEAVTTIGSVMRGTAGDAALATSRLKAAIKVVDYVDPPAKGGNTVNVNVFSEKAAKLMRALNEEDLTPRRPLPRGEVIEVEAEVIETEEGP